MLISKGPFPVEDGGIHGPRGKFYMPVFSGGGKTMTKTGTIVLISMVLAVVVIILTLTNGLSKENRLDIPNYDHCLGMTWQMVAQTLEIDQQEMNMVSNGTYKLPLGTTMAGIDFDLTMYFEEHEGMLNGYAYTARYSADRETAKKDIEKFLNSYGYDLTEENRLDFTKPILVEKSRNATPSGDEISPVRTYLDYLENSEDWEGRVAGLLAIPANWYEDLSVSYDPETEQVFISLRYGVEPRRTGVLG